MELLPPARAASIKRQSREKVCPSTSASALKSSLEPSTDQVRSKFVLRGKQPTIPSTAQSVRAPSQRLVDQIARIYTPVITVAAFLVAILPPLLFNAPFYDVAGEHG